MRYATSLLAPAGRKDSAMRLDVKQFVEAWAAYLYKKHAEVPLNMSKALHDLAKLQTMDLRLSFVLQARSDMAVHSAACASGAAASSSSGGLPHPPPMPPPADEPDDEICLADLARELVPDLEFNTDSD